MPLLMAPFGASTVICPLLPGTPVAQPANMIGGCVRSALVGIAAALLLPHT
jgi:CBS domain-containing membrane protein